MRKKGKLELPIYPTLSDIGAPEIIEVTSLTDTCRQFVASTSPGVSLSYTGPFGESKTIHYPSTHWEPYATTLDYADLMEKIGKKEEAEVKISSRGSVNGNEHIVYCEDALDLSTEKILTTISAVKGRLMFEIAPIRIKEIQCTMTPIVKKHIIEASKRLRMYGKKSPIIPSFDEYGNRLPDQIEIGDDKGITVTIVEPNTYGEAYFELKAIEFPIPDLFSEYDLPF